MGETSRRAMQKNNTKKGQTQGDSGQAQLQKADVRIMEVRTPLAEVSNSHIQSNRKDKGVKRGSSITGNLIRPHSGDPPDRMDISNGRDDQSNYKTKWKQRGKDDSARLVSHLSTNNQLPLVMEVEQDHAAQVK